MPLESCGGFNVTNSGFLIGNESRIMKVFYEINLIDHDSRLSLAYEDK